MKIGFSEQLHRKIIFSGGWVKDSLGAKTAASAPGEAAGGRLGNSAGKAAICLWRSCGGAGRAGGRRDRTLSAPCGSLPAGDS